MIDEAVAALLAAQNRNGGWGAYPARPSTTEPTALAVWALDIHAAGRPDVTVAVRRGLEWLASRQLEDGSWPTGDQVPESSWMTSLAVLALARHPEQRTRALSGAKWLLLQEGQGFSPLTRLYLWLFQKEPAVEQDMQLQGWSWADGTASWVEPTAYAMVAVKQLASALPRSTVARRVRQAELMLADRMCRGGGWNYGNKRVLGSDLEPFPDTTALGLIALQDSAHDDIIEASLGVLEEMLSENRSSLALSLGVLCLQLFGRSVALLRTDLQRSFEGSGFDGETRTLALAVLACDQRDKHFAVAPRA